MLEEADCTLAVVAGCNSLAVVEDTAAVLTQWFALSKRTAGSPVEPRSLLLVIDSGNTDSKHSKSKPQWKQ